jgi:hypothetical protein
MDECDELVGISAKECTELVGVCVDNTYLTPSLKERLGADRGPVSGVFELPGLRRVLRRLGL